MHHVVQLVYRVLEVELEALVLRVVPSLVVLVGLV
jgi:hypothetical protein